MLKTWLSNAILHSIGNLWVCSFYSISAAFAGTTLAGTAFHRLILKRFDRLVFNRLCTTFAHTASTGAALAGTAFTHLLRIPDLLLYRGILPVVKLHIGFHQRPTAEDYNRYRGELDH